MERRYAFHPGDYAIGENEKFYSDMAARGWSLMKRGRWLSRFKRAKPERAMYRIELANPRVFEDKGLPEDKLSLFEDCGWEFVTSYDLINVFRAPEGSGAPEFYMEPEQQAETLRGLRRSYLSGIAFALAIIVVYTLIFAAMSGGVNEFLSSFWEEMLVAAVEETAMLALCTLIIAYGVWQLLYGAVRTAILYKRLRRGEPLDHSPKNRRIGHKVISGALLCLCAVSAALCLVQYIGVDRYKLPQVSDGPYITLEELGWKGERDDPFGNEQEVRVSTSILAEHWDVNEYLLDGDGGVWIYQDIYRLRYPGMCTDLAQAIMCSATFSDMENFVPISIEGADAAWYTRLETVAVCDEYVIYITYSPGTIEENAMEDAARAVGAIISRVTL